jgi:rhodanese-related sulfurtransferase
MNKGKTFRERVHEARSNVRMLTPDEARQLLDHGGVLLIDVGEEWQLLDRGTIPGARNITRGELEIRADTEQERRDPALQDRQQKIILTCGGGGKATLSASALNGWVLRTSLSFKGAVAAGNRQAIRLSLIPRQAMVRLHLVRINKANTAALRRALL